MPNEAGAKPTKIDGVIAIRHAIPMIKSFQVIKDDMIPTHSVVRVTLNTKVLEQEITFIKTFPF